jgi:hypothetical protein
MSDGPSDEHLTPDDLTFLARPLLGFLTTAAGPAPPPSRPVWFEATPDGTVQLFTGPDTLKIRRLRRDPRAALIVAAHDLAARLAARYWDLDDPVRAADLDGLLAEDQVRVVLHPEEVRRVTF